MDYGPQQTLLNPLILIFKRNRIFTGEESISYNMI